MKVLRKELAGCFKRWNDDLLVADADLLLCHVLLHRIKSGEGFTSHAAEEWLLLCGRLVLWLQAVLDRAYWGVVAAYVVDVCWFDAAQPCYFLDVHTDSTDAVEFGGVVGMVGIRSLVCSAASRSSTYGQILTWLLNQLPTNLARQQIEIVNSRYLFRRTSPLRFLEVHVPRSF